MKKNQLLMYFLLAVSFLQACTQNMNEENIKLKSPKGKVEISFLLKADGSAAYLVKYNNSAVIDTSLLGFEFKNQSPIGAGFKIIGSKADSVSETWEMPWGEQREVVNNYNELVVNLQEIKEPNRLMNIFFKAYDDGIGFRYEFPEQANLDTLIITDENTQFNLTADHKVWWIPGDWDIYEHLYSTTKFSEINALADKYKVQLAQTYIPQNAVATPVTMKTEEGIYLSFHEANLTDYSGMTLKIDKENLLMQSELVGSERTAYKVKRAVPFQTPWRTIQIAEKAGDLIESNLIVNLNEPNKLGDVSWFKPTKYMGIWWEMHLGKSSWDLASGKHGATTENAKAFIDFASENKIGAVLVEGWNTGWEHWIGFEDREGVFDFVTPYPDYDLNEVVRYGKEKGVALFMHHETSAAIGTYNQQMDTAFQLMHSLGIHAVKTGYVGKIIPKGEYHHGQWMVNHFQKVIETAAKYDIAINAHEPIKATGIRRTYPNFVSREGLRGQEFNAWSSDGGNPTEHLPIVAFARMLAGPVDFTPGIFNIKLKPYRDENQINTTLAQQLALYVVIYSPVQMAADLIEHYEGQPAFQFIRDVGVNWETTKVLNGEIGDFVTIVRKERGSDKWFLGSITDENARDLKVNFNFLDNDKKYEAIVYKDGKDAHWDKNPTSIEIEKIIIDKTSKMELKLAAGGGIAISIIPVKE
ncbi:MAG: glycoside hydrolase family 97 protein [Bacteroidetes bacterium]|nr:MAG: glycoside hydrolase family 97 protein [Bacteroidota bacterium]